MRRIIGDAARAVAVYLAWVLGARRSAPWWDNWCGGSGS